MSSTIILGDLHLGKKHNVTYGDPKIWDNKSLDILKRIIAEHKPENLILAGDVFDTSKPTSLTYSQLIATIASVDRVLIIAGNHDISKVTEDIAFDNLEALDNVTLVKYMEDYHTKDSKGIEYHLMGWQPTQSHYNEKMREVIDRCPEETIIVTHCSRIDFGNENDNICTDEHIKLAKAKDITIMSGHEHKAHIGTTFNFLGSVVPHTIAEVGPRYYYIDDEFMQLEANHDIILTREEPLEVDPDKVYYVKTGKEVTVEDLKMEAKDLSIDIIEDFKIKALEAGFNIEEILND